jgi:hypothetical protein
MSEYDRRTGVKHLRVRGFKAIQFCATLKAVAVNIFRATAVRRALNGDKAALEGFSLVLCMLFLLSKNIF